MITITPAPVSACILLVEDDEAARLMMSVTLEQAGFVVVAAADCASARTLFNQHRLDIILLDVLLPDGDGFSLCRELLAHPKGQNLPVAVVTGLDDLDSIRKAYEYGATDFITKPVSWGTLPYRIQYILQASRTLLDLSVSESKTRALLSGIPDIILRVHRDGRVLDLQVGSYVYDMEEWLMFLEGEHYGRLPPAVTTLLAPHVEVVLQGAGMQLVEFQWSQQPDRERHWEARILQRDPNEFLMVVREITQRKQHEVELRLWAKVFEDSNEAMAITDADFSIISVNRAFKAITGFTENGPLNLDAVMGAERVHVQAIWAELVGTLKEKGHWQGELQSQRKNGENFPCWFSVSQVLDGKNRPENYIAIFNDITEYKSSKAQIDFLAHHDNLTGLPNRILLNDRLEHAIGMAQRRNEKLGVLFIDLDRFKNINDSLGHSAGDDILKQAASRLSNFIRAGDTVSRLGGDEFVVVLPRLKDEAQLAGLVSHLLAALRDPYQIDGINLHITPSVGIAIYPEDGPDGTGLIKNADAAMYLAKEKGRNNYQFYTPELNARTLDRLKLESDLRHAVATNSFVLHYQPQIFGTDERLWGVEALVRWRHAERGLISPAEFIPLAEETNLIIPLGEWVLREAAQQAVYWRRNGLPKLCMSVNISAVQFRQDNFVERVQEILCSVGAEPDLMELELTESILMDNMESSIATLNRLRDLGFRIAIDDFGTGYSSLNYLRRLPVNVLKIDQSFVRYMVDDLPSLAVVESIIGLAHALGKETIAEGVETEAELHMLRHHGCQLMQGFYFAKPLPAIEFERWIEMEAVSSRAQARKINGHTRE